MKIAVVGCGAVGSFYGAKLCRAGHDVSFLLRSDLDRVRRDGVVVRSVDGDFQVRPRPASEPDGIGPCDLVLVALKTTANREFSRLISPLVNSHTAILTLQNGLGSDDALAALFGPDRVLGGLCFVCLNRTAPGVIQHLAHGRVVLGAYAATPRPRTEDIAAAFIEAGVPAEVTSDLARARWEKLVWNVPFNGLGVVGVVGRDHFLAGRLPPDFQPGPGLDTQALLASPDWEPLIRELMAEVVVAAQHLGHALPPSIIEANLERTRVMGAYRASTVLDFEAGRPLEIDSIFLEPRRRAHAAGVGTPRLDRVCELLALLDPERAG